MSLAQLRDRQRHQGAVFDLSPGSCSEAQGASPELNPQPNPDPSIPGVPHGFPQEDEALALLPQGAIVVDHSHWGWLEVGGADRLRFLHNQSTNDFQRLQPGQGCETVFVTATARTLDLATAYGEDDRLRVLVSPNRTEQLYGWLDRYIFPFDKVTLTNTSLQWATLRLVGAASLGILERLGLNPPPEELHSHHRQTWGDRTLHITQGSGLALPGYTLSISPEGVADLWEAVVQAGAAPVGDRGWEMLRITQGRPAPDRELTEDYNPLEAGLWQTISFQKGCYIGQETIARLNTYKGVKQRLWGLRFPADLAPLPPLGSPITTIEGERAGKLTSITITPQGILGLGYVRTKVGGVGLEVRVSLGSEAEESSPEEFVLAEVVPLPYGQHPEDGEA
jgi:tRNA-modifying protein YgfZ